MDVDCDDTLTKLSSDNIIILKCVMLQKESCMYRRYRGGFSTTAEEVSSSLHLSQNP